MVCTDTLTCGEKEMAEKATKTRSQSGSTKTEKAAEVAPKAAAKPAARGAKAKASNAGFPQASDVTRSEFSDRVLEPLVPYEKHAKVTQELSRFLSNSYVLYVKTHGYHWNVRGPHFGSLHTLFELQYSDLALAVDALAERIRALGENAPGSMARFHELADLTESTGVPVAEEMVHDLALDHGKMSKHAATLIAAAEAVGDAVTADLATARQAVHDKASWMLRSFLG